MGCALHWPHSSKGPLSACPVLPTGRQIHFFPLFHKTLSVHSLNLAGPAALQRDVGEQACASMQIAVAVHECL